MFTHTVLHAAPSPDHAERRGVITKGQALELVRTFPFEAEVRKHEADRDLTVPTLTFAAVGEEVEFAVWSADPDRYLVWVPHLFGLAANIAGRAEVLEVLGLFFDEDWEELEERLGELAAKYSPDPQP